jgi:hypothetical protein
MSILSDGVVEQGGGATQFPQVYLIKGTGDFITGIEGCIRGKLLLKRHDFLPCG